MQQALSRVWLSAYLPDKNRQILLATA